MAASLLFSTCISPPSPHFLLLCDRQNKNPRPPLHPFPALSFPLKPFTRSSLAISASASSSWTASSLFFARLSRASSLTAPIAVVALAIARWLDLYSTLLMVRVLLSWFPNISWDRQPFSAIRDLCDPYLSIFRNIIPPLFGTLDLSPFLAFAVLSVLASILNATIP